MGNKRVLRIITRLNIGGPAIHAKILHQGLMEHGWDSRLIHGNVSPTEGDMSYILETDTKGVINVPYLIREINPALDLMALLRVLSIAMKFRPHIIHTHTSKAGTIGRVVGILLRKMGLKTRLVHTFHGHIFEGYFRGLKSRAILGTERFLARHTDALIALTETQREELSHVFRVAPIARFHVIPLGFDLGPFLALRPEGAKGEGIRIGIVGRLVPIKNHDLFFKAAALLADKRRDLSFWVIGDGERRDELKTLSSRLGIRERVRFSGWIKDMREVYKGLELLVLSSINEGTPVSIIEAMASGVPVVSTDVGGIRDLLGRDLHYTNHGGFSHRERGILCHTNRAEDLTAAIEYALCLDKDQVGRLKRMARQFAIERYSKDRLLRDTITLYKSFWGE